MRVDMHMHSNNSSDGEKTPEELIRLAKSLDIEMVALTDHDCIDGVREMMESGKKAGVKVVPAIELTCQTQDNVTHILGYNIDLHSNRFDSYLADFVTAEQNAVEELVDLFITKLSMEFNRDAMVKKCKEAPFGLVPLFEELMSKPEYRKLDIMLPYLPQGERSDLPLVNFYWDHCVKGKDFYAYIDYKDSHRIIQEIHQEGGIAILAHPNDIFFERYDLLDELIVSGIDGIECFSNYHTDEKNQWYLNYAQERNLLVVGGSDYHGSYKPHVKMGEFGCNGNQKQLFQRFLERIESDC